MRGKNGGVLPSLPHEDIPQDSPDTDHRSRLWGRRFGDLLGVISTDNEVGVIPGGRMSGKGKHSRENVGAFYVSTLEGEGSDCKGGTSTTTTV